ncbi:uncharacterized protein LOC144356247 [Saccoglossus kowalevskii]
MTSSNVWDCSVCNEKVFSAFIKHIHESIKHRINKFILEELVKTLQIFKSEKYLKRVREASIISRNAFHDGQEINRLHEIDTSDSDYSDSDIISTIMKKPSPIQEDGVNKSDISEVQEKSTSQQSTVVTLENKSAVSMKTRMNECYLAINNSDISKEGKKVAEIKSFKSECQQEDADILGPSDSSVFTLNTIDWLAEAEGTNSHENVTEQTIDVKLCNLGENDNTVHPNKSQTGAMNNEIPLTTDKSSMKTGTVKKRMPLRKPMIKLVFKKDSTDDEAKHINQEELRSNSAKIVGMLSEHEGTSNTKDSDEKINKALEEVRSGSVQVQEGKIVEELEKDISSVTSVIQSDVKLERTDEKIPTEVDIEKTNEKLSNDELEKDISSITSVRQSDVKLERTDEKIPFEVDIEKTNEKLSNDELEKDISSITSVRQSDVKLERTDEKIPTEVDIEKTNEKLSNDELEKDISSITSVRQSDVKLERTDEKITIFGVLERTEEKLPCSAQKNVDEQPDIRGQRQTSNESSVIELAEKVHVVQRSSRRQQNQQQETETLGREPVISCSRGWRARGHKRK